jgi:signal peptide peptidase SppA
MATVAADREARTAKREANTRAGSGAIAVLPFYGVVTQREVSDLCGPGSVSTQQFTAVFREALADDTIGAILIDIDSPGGSVYGTGELAAEILAARGTKPIVAIANSLAASAAYWVGCAASEFYVTPGGEVGSIGVWQAHADYSKALEMEGVDMKLISAGKYKVEGNPYEPLGEEAEAFMESRVKDYYATFSQGVSKGRGVSIEQVRNGMGQGRCLGGDAAVAENMVDGVMTFDEVIKKMQRDMRSSNSAPKAVNRSRSASLASAELDILNLG